MAKSNIGFQSESDLSESEYVEKYKPSIESGLLTEEYLRYRHQWFKARDPDERDRIYDLMIEALKRQKLTNCIMEITLLETDILFTDSPDYGPDCLCSRCQKPILNIPLRMWPNDGSGEYRFHFVCQGWPAGTDDPTEEYDDDFFD